MIAGTWKKTKNGELSEGPDSLENSCISEQLAGKVTTQIMDFIDQIA